MEEEGAHGGGGSLAQPPELCVALLDGGKGLMEGLALTGKKSLGPQWVLTTKCPFSSCPAHTPPPRFPLHVSCSLGQQRYWPLPCVQMVPKLWWPYLGVFNCTLVGKRFTLSRNCTLNFKFSWARDTWSGPLLSCRAVVISHTSSHPQIAGDG